jgi:hypothetical protein
MSEQTLNPDRTSPDHTGMIIAAVILIVAGWGGLYLLVTTQIPRVGQRWLFFLLLQAAVAGTVMPVLRYVTVRLTPSDRFIPPSGVIVREAVWFGLFVVTCAWLQIPRVLSLPIMFFLALAFIVIEVFLRSREIPNEQIEQYD